MKKIYDTTIDWKAKYSEAEQAYSFQPQLTNKLDNHKGDFTETTLLEIVLWKTNRYPAITEDLLSEINDLRKSYNEEKGRAVLLKLLNLKGFDLPMASTVLRFALPEHFQIIDQRVYRFITPEHNCLKIPYSIDGKIELYFNYLESLKSICQEYEIPFSKSDRILYQLDKTENKDIAINY